MRAFHPKGARFPVVTADNKRTKPWKHTVTELALAARGEAPAIDGPVIVELALYLPRPKSAPQRVKHPAKKPDIDKLVRAILDALTYARVWNDDSQVVSLLATKRFAGGADDQPRGVPRAEITVQPLELSALAAEWDHVTEVNA
jgi:crossover junction endodeoxyribonuclease RusA